MKLIKPSFEIIEQKPGMEGLLKHIELCGRVCYQSQDKITEDSAKGFVDRMIKSGNGSVLEHGTVYLDIPYKDQDGFNTESFKYGTNPYSKATEVPPNVVHKKWHLMVTTNYRTLIQNNWLDDLKYICKPTEYHEKRITVRFICSRAIANEFVGHRVFSFAQESQKYCNYSKDKFNNEITYIMPSWIPYKGGEYEILEGEDGWGNYAGEYIIRNNKPLDEYDPDYRELFPFLKALDTGEIQYFKLLSLGWEPQQAREVLSNACKTELVMTGTIEQWKEFFKLRTALNAHPSARELAIPLKEEFIKRGYITKSE